MSRQATDDDVVFLAARINRMSAAILEAHAQGHTPAPAAGRPLVDIISALVKMPVFGADQELARAISDYYLAVYRYMIARGSPDGVEPEWLTMVDLFRAVGDAVADGVGQPGQHGDVDDQRDVVESVQFEQNQIRTIAEAVDSETTRQAQAAVSAVVKALDRGANNNSLSTSEQRLLRLLVSGNTVDEIADQLNVSARTIHRRLQTIWDRVGASSRAEGIAITSARGWLD